MQPSESGHVSRNYLEAPSGDLGGVGEFAAADETVNGRLGF